MFVGRKMELKLLQEFKKRKVAGLIVCSGSRRIEKSTLIEYFGLKEEFWEFYGLAPRENLTNKDQLTHFSELLASKCNISPIRFDNWKQAFDFLAEFTKNKSIIIFLDEISWMAYKDKDFVGKLKGVWDTKLKKPLRKEACQIDLLIQTRHTIYVCEIKSRKSIPFSVIEEVSKKIRKLNIEKTISVRPVLIYQGEFSQKIINENFFSHYISFEDLLTNP